MKKFNSQRKLLFKLIIITLMFTYSCSDDTADSEIELEQQAQELREEISSDANAGFGNKTITMKKGLKSDCKPHREKVTRLHDYLDTRSYKMSYEIKFSQYFDFDRGGKVGYGMVVGDGVTGCQGQKSKDNKGGSFRIMWRNKSDPGVSGCKTDTDKRTSADIIPYLYFKDMSGDCGNDFGKKYGIQRNKWYKIVMTFKSNSNNNKNGTAKLQVGPSNGSLSTILNKTDVRWSGTGSKQKVTELYYHFFRGGNSKDWGSHVDGQISVRNVQLGL